MLYRLYVSPEWMESPVARRIYLGASIATLVLFGTHLGITIALAGTGQSFAVIHPFIAVQLKGLLWIGAAGAATLWVAMLYYCYGLDRSGAGAKVIWLVAMLLFGPLTALVYHFVIYRRRTGSNNLAARA